MDSVQDWVTLASSMVLVIGTLWGLLRHEVKPLRNDINRLSAELTSTRTELGGRIDATRTELREDLGGRIESVRTELGERIESVRTELRDDLGGRIDAVRTELGARIDKVDQRVAKLEDRVETLDGRVYQLGVTVGGLRNDFTAAKSDQAPALQPV